MLKRLLSTIVMLAFLVSGATVAMEAMGLLFNVGTADPQRRAEAFMAQIEANADPMNVPREPGAERLWPLPAASETAQPVEPAVAAEDHAGDGEAAAIPAATAEPAVQRAVAAEDQTAREVAMRDSAHAGGEPARQAQPPAASAGSAWAAQPRVAAWPGPEAGHEPPPVPAAAPAVAAADALAPPVPEAVPAAQACSGACETKPAAAPNRRRSARTERRQSARAERRAPPAAGADCPLFGWLQRL